MKRFLILGLTSLLSLHAQPLDNVKTTPHFAFHFSEADHEAMESFTEDLETFYIEIAQEFSFSANHPLDINVYPDIASFHEAIDFKEAPLWSVARATTDVIDIVSPSNPGPVHSQESIKQIMKLNIVKAILFNKFGQDKLPYWLAYGIGAAKVKFGNNTLKHIPSLQELETSDSIKFKEVNGFQASRAFVEFIERTYGKDALIDLLSNYEARKEALYESWITLRKAVLLE